MGRMHAMAMDVARACLTAAPEAFARVSRCLCALAVPSVDMRVCLQSQVECGAIVVHADGRRLDVDSPHRPGNL